MVWERDDQEDEQEDEHYYLDEYEDEDIDEDQTITRSLYDDYSNPDPFEVPDLAQIDPDSFIKDSNRKCGILDIDPKKLLKKVQIFKVDDLELDHEVKKRDKSEQVRRVRSRTSTKISSKR